MEAKKKSPLDVLDEAKAIIGERGKAYGEIENNFNRIAEIATLRLGRRYHPYEIAVIQCCVKNARAAETPDHADSHIDAINYESFAAMFASDYAALIKGEVNVRIHASPNKPSEAHTPRKRGRPSRK